MKILDSQGRLFGKLSILDIGAGLVILLVVIGIFFLPGKTGSVAQIGVTTKPVEMDVLVRGLSVRNPNGLIKEFEKNKKANIIIRNQPHGEVEVTAVKRLVDELAVPQPDGTLKVLPDPRVEDSYRLNMILTIAGKATMTETGPVLGNNKLKIGTSVELDGLLYNFNGSVIEVRVK
ncbi:MULTISPECIES: DUF4330 domain-containing protein [Planktothricoides]|uniref:DUF4330 domain-containing protein n=2 Tax=Planktothricoides raciborskii TaxID=132608 RepID=A0AAU8JEG5_9CYAN|nr:MULTISPECIES: DUF4330 domain-containing protein [Planktothricoides]KOR37622.1 pyruvate/2-oxoglutarate dehydrogenase complex,dihydrolipoamide dehydrogenase (E3) component [Planktothricoides sp. SR001]MBD2544033.1 DUF4330 domain-containing protein [Planktothricoides raciborskii FACHB-1370]MBD2582517.1 DUF4330 domain-containing protein [Planktothricoides raciborskii FACHB-1261]